MNITDALIKKNSKDYILQTVSSSVLNFKKRTIYLVGNGVRSTHNLTDAKEKNRIYWQWQSYIVSP